MGFAEARRARYFEAARAGLGEEDFAALLEVLEQRARHAPLATASGS